jgi:hypothetical protein
LPAVAAAVAMGAGAAVLLGAGPARADEPRNATEPHVMLESGEVTNVISSFEEWKTFRLNINLGFDYASKSATILRETSIAQPGLTTGGFTTHLLNVASYSQATARLFPRIDVGLYHDLALHITLPVILSDSRSLGQIGGGPPNPAALEGAPGEQLFGVPFQGPTRSGLEYIEAGLDFDILSQARDRTKPTWLIGAEGRFSVGTPMHACNKNAKIPCTDPSDINRDGKPDGTFEGNNFGPYTSTNDRGAGVTRGTMALELHTIMSKRLKYVEPYGGFTALFEFQQDSSDYGVTDVTQSLVNHPPLVGTMILGMEIIPWENREKYGRLTLDFRIEGQYHSEGRDYSELFDALGSSAAASLRQPQWASYQAGGNPNGPVSVINPSSQKVYVTGISDVLAYGSYRGSTSVLWQAGQYVKLQLGVGYKHDQAHVITGDAPCNPGDTSDITKSGPCHTQTSGGGIASTGLPNPNYRPTINEVGRRYWVDGSNTFDFFASVIAMF